MNSHKTLNKSSNDIGEDFNKIYFPSHTGISFVDKLKGDDINMFPAVQQEKSCV
jgi:hypothetical protein